MQCTELYPPSSRPTAMVSKLNSWLSLNFPTCPAAGERLGLFSACEQKSLYISPSICLPLRPPQSGLSLKLSLNQHAVSSDSPSSFAGLFLRFSASRPLYSPLMPFCLRRCSPQISARYWGARTPAPQLKEREKNTDRGRKIVNKITRLLKTTAEIGTPSKTRVGLTAGLQWPVEKSTKTTTCRSVCLSLDSRWVGDWLAWPPLVPLTH